MYISMATPFYYVDRLKWVNHVSQLNCEGPNAFSVMYRMHYMLRGRMIEWLAQEQGILLV